MHAFFSFNIIQASRINLVLDLAINQTINNIDFSQFNLIANRTLYLPVYSYVDSISVLKMKILFRIKEETQKAQGTENLFVFFLLARYSRIDLSRLLMKNNNYILEIVQDCDTSKVFYEPVKLYDKFEEVKSDITQVLDQGTAYNIRN
jgi:hypothetical protein